MSYCIDISIFKGVIEEKDILAKALAFCKNQYEKHMAETVREHLIYLPEFREYKEDVTIFDIKRGDREYLQNIFNYKFIYWKRFKLLGIIGRYEKTNPDTMVDICFQNSSDQDYDYETWNVLLDDDASRQEIKQLIEDTKAGNKTQTIIDYFKHRWGDDDEVDAEKDYYRKWYVYARIEDMLDVSGYLYDNSNLNIISFVLGHAQVDKVAVLKETVCAIQEFFSKASELEKRLYSNRKDKKTQNGAE